jgi:hypothetical protein
MYHIHPVARWYRLSRVNRQGHREATAILDQRRFCATPKDNCGTGLAQQILAGLSGSPTQESTVPIAARPSDPITPRKAVGTTHHSIPTKCKSPDCTALRAIVCRERSEKIGRVSTKHQEKYRRCADMLTSPASPGEARP